MEQRKILLYEIRYQGKSFMNINQPSSFEFHKIPFGFWDNVGKVEENKFLNRIFFISRDPGKQPSIKLDLIPLASVLESGFPVLGYQNEYKRNAIQNFLLFSFFFSRQPRVQRLKNNKWTDMHTTRKWITYIWNHNSLYLTHGEGRDKETIVRMKVKMPEDLIGSLLCEANPSSAIIDN